MAEKMMKVLVAKEPGVTEYIDLPIPEPADDEVLMRIHRNGICATDMELLDGSSTFLTSGVTTYPVRFGHEYSGEIVAMGKNVTGHELGEHVVGEGLIPCLHCPECEAGNYIGCLNLRSTGTLRCYPGSYAEYMILPARNLFKIDDGISRDRAALVEPAAIGMAAVNKCDIIPGKSIVLVTGVGAIGLSCAAFAKWKGAKTVIVSGRTQYKLDIAKQLGADVVINPREQDLVKTVMELTNNHGADCIIECSGNVDVMDDVFEVLAQRGTLSILAFFGRNYGNFDIDKFVLKDANVRGSCQHDFEDTFRAMADGVDLTPLITRHVTFEEAGEFMEKQVGNKTNDIKVMVDFNYDE